MADTDPKVRVTAYDPATGDTETRELEPHGYVLTLGEEMALASETGNGTGTITLVIKRRNTSAGVPGTSVRVEIPEEAYEEATDAIAAMLRSWPASASVPHHPDLSPRDVLRAFAITALEAAALSYLAPAGDGGLREALEKLADNADHYDTCSSLLNPDAGYECSCLLADIRALLEAQRRG